MYVFRTDIRVRFRIFLCRKTSSLGWVWKKGRQKGWAWWAWWVRILLNRNLRISDRSGGSNISMRAIFCVTCCHDIFGLILWRLQLLLFILASRRLYWSCVVGCISYHAAFSRGSALMLCCLLFQFLVVLHNGSCLSHTPAACARDMIRNSSVPVSAFLVSESDLALYLRLHSVHEPLSHF